MPSCPLCGMPNLEDAALCGGCGNPMGGSGRPLGSPPPVAVGPSLSKEAAEAFAEQIAFYEKLSGILWLVIAGIQILTCAGIIAGAWNIYAGVTRLKLVKHVRARRAFVPAAYEGVSMLVILGIVNLLIGGVVGVLFVLFDFYIRDQVLTHPDVFDRP